MKKQIMLTALTILMSCFLYLPVLHAQAGPGDQSDVTIFAQDESALIAALQPYGQATMAAGSYCLRFAYSGYDEGAVPEYDDVVLIKVSSNVILEIQNLNIGVKAGVRIEGGGHVVLKDSVITGVAEMNPEFCVQVQSAEAELRNVTATNCSYGIRVEADDVKVLNSNIYGNDFGVYVTNGSDRLTIKESKFHDNSGTRNIPDMGKRNVMYDAEAGTLGIKLMTVDENGVTVEKNVVNLGGQKVYSYRPDEKIILKFIDGRPADGGDLALYSVNGCGMSAPMICERKARREIRAEDINKDLELSLQPELLNASGQTMMVYTDPDKGSFLALLSVPAAATGGPVTFVTTTMDMPSLPGAGFVDNGQPADGGGGGGGGSPPVETGSDNNEETANEGSGGSKFDTGTIGGGTAPLGTDDSSGSSVAAGSGEGGTIAASISAKCSLTPSDDPIRFFALGLNLWWLIFAIGVIGGLRAVRIHIRRKR